MVMVLGVDVSVWRWFWMSMVQGVDGSGGRWFRVSMLLGERWFRVGQGVNGSVIQYVNSTGCRWF